jgi:hypothetical protein
MKDLVQHTMQVTMKLDIVLRLPIVTQQEAKMEFRQALVTQARYSKVQRVD